ncbi:MAG: hypothetical protein IJ561_04000 [Ruminococcus sp.]|nr:hypothetical protein [Ruminococcus sp.]
MNTALFGKLDYAFGEAGFTVTEEMHPQLLSEHKQTLYAVPKVKRTETAKRYFAQDGTYSQEFIFTVCVTCMGTVCGFSDGETLLASLRTALELLNGENGCSVTRLETEELTRDNATGRLTCKAIITLKGYQSYEGWELE